MEDWTREALKPAKEKSTPTRHMESPTREISRDLEALNLEEERYEDNYM